jgi:hydroxymethylglutaryl-CoA reductase (NADPH)
MFISPSMLEKVYLRGSLKNTENGFEFALKNVVEDGTVGSIKSLTVDGTEVPVSSISMATAAGELKAEEISFRSPVSLRYGMEAKVRVAGKTLEPGTHNIALTISVIEAGSLSLKFSDEVA